MRALIDLLLVFGLKSDQVNAWPTRSCHMTQESVFSSDDIKMYVFRSHESQIPEVTLYHAAQDPWQVWAVGEIFSYSSSDNSEDTTFYLHTFTTDLASRRPKPEALNGRFLLLAWNNEVRQWHVWTDRFGTLHAYYATDGSRTAIGTFFPAVAAVASKRQLDWVGLTGFFAFGFFPGDRTFFTDVRILRPASHYVFDGHGRLLKHERYWHWWHEPDRRRSYDDTVVEFAEVFHAVLDDITKLGRVAVPISGGLDSRSTVAAITRPERQLPPDLHLWAYSYGYSDDSIEIRIARQVAAARNLPFKAYTIQPYLFDQIEQVLAWTEGFQDITQCRQAFVRDEIAAHADYLIAALWGDVWLDDMGLVDKAENIERGEQKNDWLIDFAVHKMEKRGRKWLIEHLCQPHLGGEKVETLLREIVREEMTSVQHIQDPDFQVKAFKTEQWSFRWSLPAIRVFQSAAVPRLVFYDTRLADFFCTVPSEYVSGRRLQIDYLKRFAPDLARITWQVYDTNLYRYQHFNTWLLPKRALKKVWRILTGKKIIERNWEVQFLCPSGRAGLEQWLLRPGLRLHEFVSPKAIRQLLDEFYKAPLENGRGYTVSMLLTFSAWLEIYG